MASQEHEKDYYLNVVHWHTLKVPEGMLCFTPYPRLWGLLNIIWGDLVLSWGGLGPSWGGLGPLSGRFGPSLHGFPRASKRRTFLTIVLGGLGPVLGRSWGDLGPYWGDLGVRQHVG